MLEREKKWAASSHSKYDGHVKAVRKLGVAAAHLGELLLLKDALLEISKSKRMIQVYPEAVTDPRALLRSTLDALEVGSPVSAHKGTKSAIRKALACEQARAKIWCDETDDYVDPPPGDPDAELAWMMKILAAELHMMMDLTTYGIGTVVAALLLESHPKAEGFRTLREAARKNADRLHLLP